MRNFYLQFNLKKTIKHLLFVSLCTLIAENVKGQILPMEDTYYVVGFFTVSYPSQCSTTLGDITAYMNSSHTAQTISVGSPPIGAGNLISPIDDAERGSFAANLTYFFCTSKKNYSSSYIATVYYTKAQHTITGSGYDPYCPNNLVSFQFDVDD